MYKVIYLIGLSLWLATILVYNMGEERERLMDRNTNHCFTSGLVLSQPKAIDKQNPPQERRPVKP